MKLKVSIANLVMLVGGLLTFIFSFLDFYKISFLGESVGTNAWDTDAGAFVTTIPAILGIAMLVWCVLELLGTKLPERILTYNSTQMKGTWGIASIGIMFAFLIQSGDKGAGFWLMLIGSLAMAVGSIMALLNVGGQTVDLGAINNKSESA